MGYDIVLFVSINLASLPYRRDRPRPRAPHLGGPKFAEGATEKIRGGEKRRKNFRKRKKEKKEKGMQNNIIMKETTMQP